MQSLSVFCCLIISGAGFLLLLLPGFLFGSFFRQFIGIPKFSGHFFHIEMAVQMIQFMADRPGQKFLCLQKLGKLYE